MTDAAAPTYRPSPRPHPAAAPSRPTEDRRLKVVPTADSPPEVPTSGNPAEAPQEIVSAGQSGSPTEATSENRLSGLRTKAATAWTASRAYWTPPAVFTDKPASLADLAAYARHAPWTAQPYIAQPYTDEHTKKLVKTGLVRAAGIWYYRSLAYPWTVVSRYLEWFAQRPMRAVALLGGVKIFALTGPGSWAVDHIVYPAAHLAGHLFL